MKRDVYTAFWQEVSNSFFIGEAERVPFVRHNMYLAEWLAIGMILAKGFIDVGYFPTVLSRCFITYCIFGCVNDDELIDSFKKYVSDDEAKLINNILSPSFNGDFEENEDLKDFFEVFKCRTLVCKENVHAVICEIARQELIQKPHIMALAIEHLYAEIEPTTKKVLSLFSASPVTEAEKEPFPYFKRFVKGLQVILLKKLLQFLTGSDLITVTEIKVTFYLPTSDFGRRPIAHTCTPTLELPATYNNFCELREEFANILNENTWEINIV
ncbi:uncharacterized protein LOC130613563 [Hydractinia symbiolongicarpus]|uniref:uncharacterized protein LOC130613563 n=1 Tax=Hydractinia symbiolongicarpus TaxID=13093 RepID=UPI00254C70E0|nr:uncharacterized protein LOC130613563 [Hydractinia symbiolongicarpus]